MPAINQLTGADAAAFSATGTFVGAGTGAVVRTIQDKLRDVFNVRDYGAKGDLSQDDSPAIQACVNAAAGAEIFVPVGQYRLNSKITSSIPMHIQGAGNGSGPGPSAQSNANVTQFMAYFSNDDVFAVTSLYPSIFRDFQINVTPASRPATAGAGIALYPSTGNVANAQIQNCAFTNLFHGIHINQPSWCAIEDNSFNYCIGYGVYADTNAAIEAGLGNIRGNQFFQSATALGCIFLGCGYTEVAQNLLNGGNIGINVVIANNDAGFIRVIDNTIENHVQFGVRVTRSDGSAIAMVEISRNEFSVLPAGVSFNSHICIGDDAANYIRMVRICDNQIQSSFSTTNMRAIWVLSGTNILVSGNQFTSLGAGGRGIQITGAADSSGLVAPITVERNTMVGTLDFTTVIFANLVVFRSDQPLTYATLTSGALTGASGSQVYVSDGCATGATNPVLAAAGTGCLATRMRGGWYAPYGLV